MGSSSARASSRRKILLLVPKPSWRRPRISTGRTSWRMLPRASAKPCGGWRLGRSPRRSCSPVEAGERSGASPLASGALVPNERLRRPRRVGVLALQGDFREHLAALRACEVEGMPIRLATDLEAVDALILPGGESTTMAHLMEPALKQSIQQRAAAGMPVLGTCAGMILMAREIADGRPDQEPLKLMDMGVRRNAYGRQIDSFEADVTSPAIGGSAPAVFIRAPQLTQHSPDVEELARHGDQIVAVKQGNRLALAFHPELTPDRRWHQYFLSLNGETR